MYLDIIVGFRACICSKQFTIIGLDVMVSIHNAGPYPAPNVGGLKIFLLPIQSNFVVKFKKNLGINAQIDKKYAHFSRGFGQKSVFWAFAPEAREK